jgi:hypothetical protein
MRASRSFLLVALSLLAAVAEAATVTWSATPVSGNWSVGANWAGGAAPNPGDDLVFPATSTILSTTNDLVAGIAINSITFNGNGYRLAGNAILLGNGSGVGIKCTSGAAPGSDAVSMPIAIQPPGAGASTAVGCTLTLSGAISGAGGLGVGDNAANGGIVILSGFDTYTGSTNLHGLTSSLYVDGTLSGTSGVVLEGNSGTPPTLGGTGTIASQVSFFSPSVGGTIFPANGSIPSILSTGNVTFDGIFALFGVTLNGPTVGTQYSQLNVNGTVTLGTECLIDGPFLGFVPEHGTQFTIIKNSGGSPVSGTFLTMPEGATFVVNSTTFQISYVGGSGHDVVLTVISPWVPTALAVDAGGNGVLEAGELTTLQPTWMNSSGASSTLTGATTNFTGPAGPTYSNPDASGSYGTLADGTSAPCTDCYTVQVSGTRPAQHWDATIDETVTPTSTKETWVLHVGESFPDVPTSQQFYKYIENLFHNGITGGCGGGNYCPDSSVTRAQMAVFLLKGKHGSGYLPPPCSATVFTDEPCPGGLYVDWVNQLASESITSGCGGGNYCPINPVTRGQMSAFLLKAQHGGTYVPPACSATVFTDVVCPGAPFVNFINQLAAEGITGGCGGGNYCPGSPNTRGQMAVFLVKTFELLLYRP